ncbi:hypothetical protein MGYG_02262 [Nannizzia gypsea CBS 118893]|uniref:Uncharacterized protein n=1 Tax=Arthroderma gypseum (strain ATCC MYA-4604 / CBS 118893) TaxID=535722 RepID=E4UQM0_ARTGP|nr:hypothetical protein MGYG_02262 [Nannizzia gypsea CBS 118893]EFQ99249.1 hypothetical protein MGYG_02262 [Nannizzia gypsea CBS 118893]
MGIPKKHGIELEWQTRCSSLRTFSGTRSDVRVWMILNPKHADVAFPKPILGRPTGIFVVLFCPGARGESFELVRIGAPGSCLVAPGPLLSAPVLTEIAGVFVDNGWFLLAPSSPISGRAGCGPPRREKREEDSCCKERVGGDIHGSPPDRSCMHASWGDQPLLLAIASFKAHKWASTRGGIKMPARRAVELYPEYTYGLLRDMYIPRQRKTQKSVFRAAADLPDRLDSGTVFSIAFPTGVSAFERS